jgi:hypothetical protein
MRLPLPVDGFADDAITRTHTRNQRILVRDAVNAARKSLGSGICTIVTSMLSMAVSVRVVSSTFAP